MPMLLRCSFILSTVVMLMLVMGVGAWGADRTISVDFKYTDPDGNQQPIRWVWCELRDKRLIRDSVLAEGYTDGNGRVVFVYDASKPLIGSRPNPYVRAHTRLGVPHGDGRHELGRVTKKRYVALTQLRLAYHELNTPVWDKNNQDRTNTTVATGETNHAFFIMDAIATANSPGPGQAPGGGYVPRMALGHNAQFCHSPVRIIYPAPSAVGTSYSSPFREMLICRDHHESFDSIIHEYGHHEMNHYYGGVFGDYGRTQRDHSFDEPVGDDWTAFCEAWANFSPIITRLAPLYRAIDVEAPRVASASARTEGFIVRVMWDICDRWDSQVVLGDGTIVPRPLTGNMQLDDDPIGLAPGTPLSNLDGLRVLKMLIRTKRPKSLWELRDAWREEYSNSPIHRRAFDAILWSNGLREVRANGVRQDLVNHPPTCTLSITGPSVEDTVNDVTAPRYTGDVTLTAQVTDVDAVDSDFHHVVFYWTTVSQFTGRLFERDAWGVIGADVYRPDGVFTLQWPREQQPQNPNLPVYVCAVASDCFDTSAFSLDPADLTPGQVGPVFLAGAAPEEDPEEEIVDEPTDTGPQQGTRAETYRHSRCATIVGWQWLRTTGAGATWRFSASVLDGMDLDRVRLLFNGLITNQASGGAGYSSVLTFNLRVDPSPGGGAGAGATVTVPTVNPFGRIDPTIRDGRGYRVHGAGGPFPRQFVTEARRAGSFTVELIWPSGVDNRYHVAVKHDSVTIGLSGADGGG